MSSSAAAWPSDPEAWMHISPTCQSIRDKSINFPPKEPGYYEFPSCMLDKAGLQIQHEWNRTVLTNLMSALPHFDVAPKPEDPSTLPWRVLWPYHPVIETFGQANAGFLTTAHSSIQMISTPPCRKSSLRLSTGCATALLLCLSAGLSSITGLRLLVINVLSFSPLVWTGISLPTSVPSGTVMKILPSRLPTPDYRPSSPLAFRLHRKF